MTSMTERGTTWTDKRVQKPLSWTRVESEHCLLSLQPHGIAAPRSSQWCPRRMWSQKFDTVEGDDKHQTWTLCDMNWAWTVEWTCVNMDEVSAYVCILLRYTGSSSWSNQKKQKQSPQQTPLDQGTSTHRVRTWTHLEPCRKMRKNVESKGGRPPMIRARARSVLSDLSDLSVLSCPVLSCLVDIFLPLPTSTLLSPWHRKSASATAFLPETESFCMHEVRTFWIENRWT